MLDSNSKNKMQAFLSKAEYKSKRVSFDEEVWYSSIERLDELRDSGFVFGFEERILLEFIEIASKKPKEEAIKEIEYIRDVILIYPLDNSYFIAPFLTGLRSLVKAASLSVILYLKGEYNKNTSILKLLQKSSREFDSGDKNKALALIGEAGALVLLGRDLPNESEDYNGLNEFEDYVRGIETLNYLIAVNDMQLP